MMEERRHAAPAEGSPRDMEFIVGWILLAGVLASVAFIAAGLVWRSSNAGSPRLDYQLSGSNLFEFCVDDIAQATRGAFRPRLLVNIGLALLMLTPFLRVLVSMIYFAVERNAKYTVFTGFVLALLTYSLFLR